jgi:gliding motility-associated-like protein
LNIGVNVPGGTFAWSTGDNTSSISVQNSGEYYVDATLNGCTISDSIDIVFNSLSFDLGSDTAICSTQSYLIQATNFSGANYLWSTGATSNSISINTNGVYSLTIQLSNGCFNSDSIEVLFYPDLNPTITGSTSICAGESAVISVSSNGGQYQWSSGEINDTIVFNGLNSTTLIVTISDTNGCQVTDSVYITVHQIPTIDISYDSTSCNLENITFSAITNGNTWIWSTGQNGGTLNFNQVTIPDTIGLDVSSSNGCVNNTYILGSVIQFQNSPLANFEAIPLGYLGDSYLFQDVSSSDVTSWSWDFGDTTFSIAQSPSHTYDIEGLYTVLLTVENSLGCTDTISRTIKYEEKTIIPNVFSPNGDGKNELFVLNIAQAGDIILRIYNRWGLKVFETEKNKPYWDGKTLKGDNVPDGTYYYVAMTKNKEKPLQSGYITLSR